MPPDHSSLIHNTAAEQPQNTISISKQELAIATWLQSWTVVTPIRYWALKMTEGATGEKLHWKWAF